MLIANIKFDEEQDERYTVSRLIVNYKIKKKKTSILDSQ